MEPRLTTNTILQNEGEAGCVVGAAVGVLVAAVVYALMYPFHPFIGVPVALAVGFIAGIVTGVITEMNVDERVDREFNAVAKDNADRTMQTWLANRQPGETGVSHTTTMDTSFGPAKRTYRYDLPSDK